MLRLAVILVAMATPAIAQVGYDPHNSPYRDLRETQELTAFTGFYNAKKDPAGVAPQSGPLFGFLYQWRPGGPANLNASITRLASQRRILDPDVSANCPTAATEDCKLIGTFRWPVYFLDAGLAIALTGARSFYSFVPEVKLGAGAVTDFHTKADVGEFTFGTRFAFNWGAGIRWIASGPLQLRADFTNHLYSIKYPGTYYLPAADNSVIFTKKQSQTAWLNNPGFTIGFSYLFSR
ncbi:MAG TPA: hypothetical protein VJ867_08740 [Gemmatimonadaceae bacterium]|nr:hypothetical protein [Gemmatimonadaceae bacterium]